MILEMLKTISLIVYVAGLIGTAGAEIISLIMNLLSLWNEFDILLLLVLVAHKL